MDNRSRQQLKGVGQSIPMHLLRRAMIKEKPYAEDRERLESFMRSGQSTREQKRAIAKILNDPKMQASFDRVETRVDEKVAKQIEEHVTRQVQRDIRSGRLKKADKRDPFFKRVRSRMSHNMR